jgi:hypothetical protein
VPKYVHASSTIGPMRLSSLTRANDHKRLISMSGNFQLIQLQIDGNAIKKLPNRQRHQLVGCMHAHNELAVLNRLLMFTFNDVGEGQLHDYAHGVQMWCVLQVLIGKLFETWNMLSERFLKSNPEDSAIAGLSDEHKRSLAWLKNYFGDERPRETPLRMIRNRTAFHYDKLNLDQAVDNLPEQENRVYLSQHPANALYYAGSALVFSTVFASIADKATETNRMTHGERMSTGVNITHADVNEANLHMHNVLYGLIESLLEKAFGKPIREVEQTRIQVRDAPKPTEVGMPMFIDVVQT